MLGTFAKLPPIKTDTLIAAWRHMHSLKFNLRQGLGPELAVSGVRADLAADIGVSIKSFRLTSESPHLRWPHWMSQSTTAYKACKESHEKLRDSSFRIVNVSGKMALVPATNLESIKLSKIRNNLCGSWSNWCDNKIARTSLRLAYVLGFLTQAVLAPYRQDELKPGSCRLEP